MGESCSCGNENVKLIYSCSGAANTGFLADNVARNLVKKGKGKMTCLAAVGAELNGFKESAKCADKNIVIDGCSIACGKLIMEKNNIPFEHFILTNYGVEKAKTEITSELIFEMTEKIAAAI